MNFICFIGNLTRDCEIYERQDGSCFTTGSIAVPRNYKNAEGEKEVDFFNFIMNNGEGIAGYLIKGTKVCIRGSIENKKYTDRDGVNRDGTTLKITDIEILKFKDNVEEDEDEEEEVRKPVKKATKKPNKPNHKNTSKKPVKNLVRNTLKKLNLEAFDDDSAIPF